MKKALSILLALILLVPVAALAACSSSEEAAPIKFGAKYMRGETETYVFNADKTGYCEYYQSETDYTRSGRVDFVWRETPSGAVYLFQTDVRYNADHTEGKSIPLISDALYFAEEFFTYSYHTQFGASTRHYIIEGSALDRALKK